MINLDKVSSILSQANNITIDISNSLTGKANVSNISVEREYDREYKKKRRLAGSLFEDSYNRSKASTLLQDINVSSGSVLEN